MLTNSTSNKVLGIGPKRCHIGAGRPGKGLEEPCRGWAEPGACGKLGTALPLPAKWSQDVPSPGCPQTPGAKKGERGGRQQRGHPSPCMGPGLASVPSARGWGRAEGPWAVLGALQKLSGSVRLQTQPGLQHRGIQAPAERKRTKLGLFSPGKAELMEPPRARWEGATASSENIAGNFPRFWGCPGG